MPAWLENMLDWLKERPWAVIAISVLGAAGFSSLVGWISSRDSLSIIRKAGFSPAAYGEPVPASPMASGSDSFNSSSIPAGSPSPIPRIQVYVVGAVNAPGLVEMAKGDLVAEAIRLAGGFAANADMASVNAAYRLEANAMVKVSCIDQTLSQGSITQDPRGITMGQTAASDSGEGGTSAIHRIDLNSAGIKELETLPGIGEQTARDIIAYREANGPFMNIEDIMQVSGIKQARFDKIREYVYVMR
ncbi:MAG TPA: hypothetical protein DD727_02265 [Clostridiales bacterium]|nr:hypothetical protein [Clostridiales bacterium]